MDIGAKIKWMGHFLIVVSILFFSTSTVFLILGEYLYAITGAILCFIALKESILYQRVIKKVENQ